MSPSSRAATDGSCTSDRVGASAALAAAALGVTTSVLDGGAIGGATAPLAVEVRGPDVAGLQALAQAVEAGVGVAVAERTGAVPRGQSAMRLDGLGHELAARARRQSGLGVGDARLNLPVRRRGEVGPTADGEQEGDEQEETDHGAG